MIELTKLREIAKSDPELRAILLEEPAQMSEEEFMSKFSLLWNLPRRAEKQKNEKW